MSYFLGSNKKLYCSHFIFFIFFLFLLIFPKLPLSADGTSLNLAIIILFIWFGYNSLKFKSITYNKSIFLNLFIIFSIFFLITSLLSFKIVVLLNAFQFLVYVILFSLILNKYLHEVQLANDFVTTASLINFVGLIYAIGSILSIFTGPIYPFQVGDNQRIWGQLIIQQGVGFGVNQNSVGGILVLLLIFCFFFIKTKYKYLQLLIYFLGILSTVSRSSFMSLVIGFLIYKIILFFKKRTLSKASIKNLLIFTLIFLALFFYFKVEYNDYYEVFKIGLGLGDIDIKDSEAGRFDAWSNSFSKWHEASFFDKLFGVGYKNSSEIFEGKYISSHNLFIQYLLDSGLLGFIIFFLSIFSFIFNILRRIFKFEYTHLHFYFLFSITSLLIHNFTETFLYGVDYVSFLIFLFIFFNNSSTVNN